MDLPNTKGIDGYYNCLYCNKEFPFRKTLLVRGIFSKKYNCMIGKLNQKYCSLNCSLMFRNTNNNPSKTSEGRAKISEFAKKRGTAHLNTDECRKKMIKTISGDGHWNWKGDKSHPNCLDCGIKISFRKQRCRECYLKTDLKGEKSYNWKGGVSPVNNLVRASKEYKLWRESVFKRDNWTCVLCNATSGKGKKVTLNADHIKPFCNHIELRFDINNGRTLCVPCHKKTETYGVNARYY